MTYLEALDDARRRAVTAALKKSQGNMAAAAKTLDIQRTYLYSLVKRLGLPLSKHIGG